jgi:hypothetical protein
MRLDPAAGCSRLAIATVATVATVAPLPAAVVVVFTVVPAVIRIGSRDPNARAEHEHAADNGTGGGCIAQSRHIGHQVLVIKSSHRRSRHSIVLVCHGCLGLSWLSWFVMVVLVCHGCLGLSWLSWFVMAVAAYSYTITADMFAET